MVGKYKICILTAGQGSRLGDRVKYTNKALLRVGNKAAISHQIDYFSKDDEIVIALGYNGNIVKQYLDIAHPGRKFTFIDVDKYGEGYGPGYALLKCKEHLQCSFYFLTCDSLIGMSEEKDSWIDYNWAFCCPISKKDIQKYCTVKIEKGRIKKIYNKDRDGTTDAFIGIAYIKDYEEFWVRMCNERNKQQEEIQVADPILSLTNIKPYIVTWYDIGSEAGLKQAREHYLGLDNLDKLDEELYIFDDYVVKYFYNENTVSGRLKRCKKLQGLVPDIISSSKNFYKYKFIKGQDLFRISQISEVFPLFLEDTKNNLWKDVELLDGDKLVFKDACRRFYYDKTIARLDKFFKEKNFKDVSLSINEIKIPSLKDVLNLIDWDCISDGVCSNFHGDFTLSNIILNEEDFSFKYVDFRQDFAGIVDYGDRYYDLAKLYAGLLLPHNSIKNGNFYIKNNDIRNIKTFVEISTEIEKSKDYYEEWLFGERYDIKKVRILASIIFLNMAALHENPLDEYLYYYGKYYLYKTMKDENLWIC